MTDRVVRQCRPPGAPLQPDRLANWLIALAWADVAVPEARYSHPLTPYLGFYRQLGANVTFNELLDIGRASLGPIVAVLAVAIAYGQYRIQRDKAKSDLFARRFDVFRRSLRYVQSASYDARASIDAARDFNGALIEAQFLFQGEICDFLIRIRDRGVDIDIALDAIQRTPPEDELSYRYKIQESKMWMAQAEAELGKAFEPYLRLT